MPLDGVPPFVLVKAYGGSPPPFDQPRLVALLKPKAVVGCEGGGDGGGGLGDGGGRLGNNAATTMIGADSTVMPSAVVAAVALGRAAESVACTWVEVLEAGTAMVAVTITEAAVTAMLTA